MRTNCNCVGLMDGSTIMVGIHLTCFHPDPNDPTSNQRTTGQKLVAEEMQEESLNVNWRKFVKPNDLNDNRTSTMLDLCNSQE